MELAQEDKISLDRFVFLAVMEKLSAWITLEYMAERAKRGNRKKFLKALSKVPDVEPEEFDKL